MSYVINEVYKFDLYLEIVQCYIKFILIGSVFCLVLIKY